MCVLTSISFYAAANVLAQQSSLTILLNHTCNFWHAVDSHAPPVAPPGTSVLRGACVRILLDGKHRLRIIRQTLLGPDGGLLLKLNASGAVACHVKCVGWRKGECATGFIPFPVGTARTVALITHRSNTQFACQLCAGSLPANSFFFHIPGQPLQPAPRLQAPVCHAPQRCCEHRNRNA
jgi:hypothetical protein